MKKRIFNFSILIFTILFIGIACAFADFPRTINVVKETNGSGDEIYLGYDENGDFCDNCVKDSSEVVTQSFAYKYSGTKEDPYVCITGYRAPVSTNECTYSSTMTNKDEAIAVGYLVHKFNLDGEKVNFNRERYYWLELSVLSYLDKWEPVWSSFPEDMISDDNTPTILGGKSTFKTEQQNAEKALANYKAGIKASFSSDTLTFNYNQSDGYYYSQEVTLTTTGNVEDLDVSLGSGDSNEGFELVTVEQNKKYKVRIAKSIVVGKKISASIVATASADYYRAIYYDCNAEGYQDFVSGVNVNKETKTSNDTTSGSVSVTKLVIKKTDAKGNPIAGVQINIKGPSYDKTITTTASTSGYTLDSLPFGTYEIKEVSAPDNYILTSQVKTVTFSDTKMTETVSFTNDLTKVEISKLDSKTGKLLEGVVLQIEDEKGNVIKDSNGKEYKWTTTDSKYVIDGLKKGTYYLKEVSAPDGYVLNTERKKFVVDGKTTPIKVELKNDLTQVEISKIDSKTGKLLKGAVLQIEDEKGTIIKDSNNEEYKWTTTSSKYIIEGLKKGTYYLKEVSTPDGYVLNDKRVKFEVDGKTKIVEVEMENTLTKVQVKKLNGETGKLLKGAVLQIEDEKGNIIKDSNGKEYKWETTEEVYEMEGLNIGTYYLREVSAPAGYDLNKERIKFEVDGKEEVVEVEMKNRLNAKVPDTLGSRSTLLTAISMFDIALGIGLLTYVKKNKAEE